MLTCSFEDGAKVLLRHVTVAAIVLNDQKQALLVKRAPYLNRGNKYTIPGGFLDRDEDAEAGALRELYEETGIEGQIVMLFRINDNPNRPKEDRQNIDFIYIAKIVGGEFKENDEVTEIRWFDYDQIPSEEEFAFDHRETVGLYYSYLKNPFNTPIIGKINKKL